MVYPITVYGSAVLRAETQKIDSQYPELERLLADMYETMYEAEGIGLAAPQIGKSIKVFVIDTINEDDDGEKISGVRKTFINPEIYEYFGDDISFEEGCLSIPGIRETVIRPNGIKIRYMDANFQPCDETFEGLEARVIQHEYDHLDGEMFVDKVAQLRKTLIKSKLTKIPKGEYRAFYKTKIIK